jgi:DNA-binding MarR family transcriptional regulator
MHSRDARLANLLGAWAQEAAEALDAAGHEVAGAGGGVPAALTTIGARPGLTMEELRAALRLSQPGALRLVERLERSGRVRRRAGTGRARGLELTAAGRRAEQRLLARRRERLLDLLAPLDEDGRQRLTELLELLLAERTHDHDDLERLCRLCERTACARCPVEHALL